LPHGADDTAHVDFQQFIDAVAAVYARRIIAHFPQAMAVEPP
jgi:hypothetical protein